MLLINSVCATAHKYYMNSATLWKGIIASLTHIKASIVFWGHWQTVWPQMRIKTQNMLVQEFHKKMKNYS